MNLDDALYRAITSRGRKLSSEDVPLQALVHELQAALGGSSTKAGRALGIPPRTWRRWASGATKTASHEHGRMLQQALRRVRLSATRERFLRGAPHIVVHAEVKVSKDIRDRKLLVSGWPDRDGKPPITGMMRSVLDAWLLAHDLTAAHRFMAPIEGGVDGDLDFADVHAIRFFAKRQDALRFVSRS